ncbi:MAG: zinc metallopeptidase [Chloroflexi bacterium CFX6]|nr:zinc metallopeptidase [Chloroflexi bacterium CFX6]
MFFNGSYLLWVFLPTMLLTLYAQWRVKSAYAKWSQVANERGINGLQTAQMIMRDTGLDHIEVRRTPGFLTDHYDPRDKSINLSEGSTAPSIAAMAIVAHELGHAEQDKVGNAMLNLRASLVPVANLGSGLGVWLIVGGLMLNMTGLAWAGVALFGAMVLFTLVTLPVEFDASRRAKRNLQRLNLVSATEAKGVNAVLDAAALTYVAAAAGAVINLLYYVSLLSGRSRD